jgi:asparagine synthase (glutamine-hydrolysing)
MSAICAVLRLDGRPAQAEMAAPVLAALAPRGPDGSRIATDGPLALGHALNATTPEAQVEPMPLRHAESACLIAADVRLDNREDLIAAIGLDQRGRVIGDGELILAAYLKWGPDCPAHLLGDFAFALWDPRKRQLFAARDKVGMRQLVYHFAPGKLFADFIQKMEAFDDASTFYVGLHRLPPGHSLTVTNGTLRLRRYWQLDPAPVIHRKDDADYEEAFLEVFTEAVRGRLRSAGGLGSMLSGGMDSGSVVAVAARLLQASGAPPLRTVSALRPDADCLESNAIREAMAMPHLAPLGVSTAAPEEFREEVAAMVRTCAEPFDGHMAMVMAVYAKARGAGINAMLDGVSGDTTLNAGNIVSWHMAAGRIGQAWQEARADERYWGHWLPARREFAKHLRRRLVPLPVREAIYAARLATGLAKPREPLLLDNAFAARIGFAARERQFRARVTTPDDQRPETRVHRMLHPYAIAARERYDRIAGACGIEPRDPFLDPRLLAFCLTLPPDRIKRDGWPKLILRRSMAGLLPDSLRWRTGRTHVGSWFVSACEAEPHAALPNRLGASLCPFVDQEAVERLGALLPEYFAVASLTELRYLAAWISGIAQARKIGD